MKKIGAVDLKPLILTQIAQQADAALTPRSGPI
jgi:hypothetical protein